MSRPPDIDLRPQFDDQIVDAIECGDQVVVRQRKADVHEAVHAEMVTRNDENALLPAATDPRARWS